jgi:type VI secretion system secreted protein VgrG
MLSAYGSAIGVNDWNIGAVNLNFFQTVALTTARASGDLLQVLNLYSVQRATGDALQRLALEYDINPGQAQEASGLVNVYDTSFTKISTNVYSGTPAPNVGSTVINVSNAGAFPASGAVYLGRGTPDVEGPISYATPPVQLGSYWTITLSTPTTKYHNLGETVILAQGGNRPVAANVIVVSPGIGISPSIQYGVVTQAVILDGETEVDNVQVQALTPGSSGNVPANSVTQFASPPFTGATVNNPLPFTTGADSPTELQLRTQILNVLASQGLGTATAVEAAVLGATATESTGIVDTVVSDSLVNNTNGTATLYIDNGNGYEATYQGVALESIVDSALGGEQFFQLQTGGNQAPVVKAFLKTVLAEPYALVSGDTLAVSVGGVVTQHTFSNSDFVSPGYATAYEVTASINADTTLNFEATTSDDGTYVIITGIADFDTDTIFITVPTTTRGDAATLMGFPTSTEETLRLYLNGIPLTQDGIAASVFTQAQQLWSNTIANGDTLVLSVDGTAPITYTVTNADFIATGLYTSVNNNNTLTSWALVFNNLLTGVTAAVVGDQIELSSNLGANDRANVTIGGSSTLVTKGMFSATLGLSSQGAASQFTLDRNTAQFELVTPLVAGDVLSAGSAATAGYVKSTVFASNSVTLPAAAHVWILTDTPGTLINTGVIANTLLSVSTPSTNVIRYTSNVPSAFSNVLPGDYVIVWSVELPATDRFEGRVHAVTSTTLDILITPAEWAAVNLISDVTFQNGFVILRSNLAPQRFEVPAGTLTLDQVAEDLQPQTEELVFSVFLEEQLVITTNTLDSSGSVLIVTSDTNGIFLQLMSGTLGQSQQSLLAYYDSRETTADFPLFIHSTFSTPEYANPPDSFIYDLGTTVVLDPTHPNNLICMLHPYGGINDAQDFGETPQISSLSGNAVTIAIVPPPPGVPAPDPVMHRVRTVDRFYVGSPLQFGYGDTMVSIVDGNAISQSYTIPMYRDALTNTTDVVNANNFNAYDADAGPTTPFSTYFSNFNFANFKVYMQAKHVLKPTPSETAILYRAAQWGSSGEQVTVEYVYPTSANQAIGSSVVVGETVAVDISLASGAVASTNISASTIWNVIVTPGVPSSTIEQVTYVWAGSYIFTVTSANATAGAIYSNNGQNFLVTTTIVAGTTLFTTGLQNAPAASGTLTKVSGTGDATITFSSYTFAGFGTNPMLTLSGGEYVNISTQTGFFTANTGIYRVSTQAGYTPTATSFSVQMPNGQAINQSGASTLVNGAISFYEPSPTTAAQVVTYVNANLSSYVSAALVNDGGLSGAGVIALSTYEDSGFTIQNVQLLDGVNWILTSNVNSSPQFVLKLPLSYPSAGPWYAFNNGEPLRLVPTTIEQVYRFLNVLAVTGLTTVGAVGYVDRGTSLLLATDTLGSAGSIQIVGGSANLVSLPVLSTATNINNNLTEVSVDSVAAQPITSDQWFRLQAAQTQIKVTGFSDNTDVTVIGSDPTTGESTIVISNSNLTQRNFGKPRSQIRTEGDTFRVENQGKLVCVSWTGVGTNPMFESALSFNDSFGGTANIVPIAGTSDAQITITSGSTNFTELSIGDLITISGGSILGTAGTFAILAASAITNTGSSILTGNLGIAPGTSITGFPPGTYTGTEDINNSASISAQADALAAYNSLNAMTSTPISAVLDGQTLTPGVYSTGAASLAASGNATMTFNGAGIYVIQIASTLTTGSGGIPLMILTGGATAANIYWVVGSSATIESGHSGTFEGNLIAHTSITSTSPSSVNGSLIALNGAVTVSSPSNITALGANVLADSNQGTFVVTGVSSNGTVIQITNPNATMQTGAIFSVGNFSATSGVSEGDTVIMGAPFASLNQGQFRVIREYNNSFWIENPDAVEEEVNLAYNPVSLGFDGTTEFNVTIVNNLLHLEWNGVGTQPTLSNAEVGDIITLGTDFALDNQGSFMVVDSSVGLPQITELFLPAGSAFALSGAGTYFHIYSAGNATTYYVWFNVNSSNTDPAPGGTGVQVAILSGDTATNVASKTALALTGIGGSPFIAVASGNTVTVTTSGDIETNPTANVNVPAPFEVETLQSGTRTYLEVIDPVAVPQSDILITNVLQDHRPQMQFWEYEATVPGDLFVATGSILTLANAGSYPVVQVLNSTTAIVKGNMTSVSDINLNNNTNSVYVEEGVPYSGYKHVFMVSAQPGAPTRDLVVFDTTAQYNKIDPSASVEMTSVGKLNFNTILLNGLDAYSYNTGLIQVANQIVYGDPRDPITYPGVGAAGADIFIKAPLVLNVSVAIDIRLATGAPFPAIQQQVQSNVAALINSNPVGQSIDISSIVSTARTIPGITSVAISSPLYSPTDDLIQVTPAEKTFVLNPATQISVSLIGS